MSAFPGKRKSDHTDHPAPPTNNSRRDDEREENAAKYREKVDELNRSRDVEMERAALTLRAGR
jgi:hypothetical protein